MMISADVDPRNGGKRREYLHRDVANLRRIPPFVFFVTSLLASVLGALIIPDLLRALEDQSGAYRSRTPTRGRNIRGRWRNRAERKREG